MSGVYYNENDPFAAQWLRDLIAGGHIALGDVDERSIVDVQPSDLISYPQVHLFAGIGGWSLALRLAGVPDDYAIWTGSCPCQPFSGAGKRKGTADARHLWPEMRRLIAERRPARIVGEQVASKDGRLWLARVRADLEALGYGVGAADLCAAGIGAPHIRQRVYWVAEPSQQRQSAGHAELYRSTGQAESHDATLIGGVGDADAARLQGRRIDAGEYPHQLPAWAASQFIACTDGRSRRTPLPESSIQPLAYGVPNRVGTLRGSGNAIVPQLAAEFISAYLEATGARDVASHRELAHAP